MIDASGWNYDISQIPKGNTVIKKIVDKNGKVREVKTFVPDYVILCADDEWKTVTKSRWIPPKTKPKPIAGRWEFFAVGQQPLAWQPYPKHPKHDEPSNGGE